MGKSYRHYHSPEMPRVIAKDLEKSKSRSRERECLSRIRKGEDPDDVLFDDENVVDIWYYD